MTQKTADEEIRRLQGSINDLTSIQALPAIWNGRESGHIAGTLLDVLVSMLRLDFAYARLSDSTNGSPVEFVRLTQRRTAPSQPQEIGRALDRWLTNQSANAPLAVPNPAGDGEVRIAPLRLGLMDEIGMLVAGSKRADFPTPTETLLLRVAANQALVALQEARQLHEQNRAAEELERRVADRTAQLTTVNEALRESEKKYRTLFDSIDEGFCTIEVLFDGNDNPIDYRFLEVNPSFEKQTGIRNAKGRRMREIAPQHEEHWFEIYGRIALTGEPVRFENQAAQLHRWYDAYAFRVGEPGDRKVAILFKDITERKQAEEELRRSEGFLAQGERIGHTGSWSWHVATGLVYWSKEHFRIFDYDPETTKPSYSLLMERIHPEDRFSFEEILNRAVRGKSDFEYDYRIVLPDRSTKFLRSVGQALVNPTGELEFIGTVMDITDLKRGEEMRAAMARERELFAQQRATELAKANEALRGCLDALASVPELDDFLGQVMATITRQLGAVSSTLRVRNFEQNTLPLELVFQDGRVMTPDEAKYPECWQSVSLEQFDPDFLSHSGFTRTKDEQRVATFLNPPAAIIGVLDPHSPMPDDQRSYLRELGIKTVLIIPLTSRGQVNGRLTFRFTEERDFGPEELEIARALATQASLAIHLTRLAKSARQSAVLEERNQLAAEIHDALAQSFTGISMQLGVAGEQLAAKEGDPLCQIQLANEIAKFGLAEARRSILSLRSSAIEESGLTKTLQRLVEHSNVAGRLRCDFRSDNIPEESLPPRIQHELLRFAQEAISNAVRHARPTVVSVRLRWEPPNLILKVKDNGSGISSASLEKSEGFGLGNMRTRASQIDGKLDIQTAAGHGTSIVLTVPIPS
jgi:PAS domain S-box-containing protein